MMLILVGLLDDLNLGFCYRNLRRKTGGIELASTITLVLESNRLTMCVSHPKIFRWLYMKYENIL